MNRIYVAALGVLLCLGCGHKNDVLLRLQFTRGQAIDVKYRTYIAEDNDESRALQNEYVRMGFTIDSALNDSLYAISAKIDYLRAQSGGYSGGGEFASDKDEADMTPQEKITYRFIKPIIDSTYKSTINTRGQLLKPFPFTKAGQIPVLNFPIDFETFQIVFPKQAVAIGDEWTSSRNFSETGETREITYYIENIFDGKIQIKATGTLPAGGGANEFTGRYMLDQKTKNLLSVKLKTVGRSMLGGSAYEMVDIEAHSAGVGAESQNVQ